MNGIALLLDTFRQEATELLDELAKILDAQRAGQGDAAALISARRVAHNLKGAALSVGARRISEACHLLEDELEATTRAEAPASAEQLEAWLRIVTELEQAVEDPQLIEASVSAPETPDAAVSVVESINAAEATIRVETRRLDEVMGHLREIAQNQVRLTSQNRALRELRADFVRVIAAGDSVGEFVQKLDSMLQQNQQEVQELGYRVDALNASMNQLRMTPLAGMTALWQRTIRETSRELDRPAQLDVDVGEVEVDVHLYELLKDPLLHILRNAIAHGIEPADLRQATQKPRVGRIRLEGRADGALVRLRVSDDGRGIDPERVARRAVERGWITATAAAGMSDAERRALTFLPGFSTAEVITTVAGRGMGLHSVQRNIEELGGSVTVSVNPILGGTTFEIQIPATVLSVKGLLVQSSGVTYALPLHDVAQVAAVGASALERSEGSAVFIDSTGRPVRVRALDPLLGKPAGTNQAVLHLVVLRRTGQELALIVDRVVGEQEFVTRALPWNIEGTIGINGTLILADGSVALFLDTTALLAASRQSAILPQPLEIATPAPARRVLIVDDSLTARTLQAQTLNAAGYEVSAFADGKQAWEALEHARFNLVVADVQMPNLDGFELTSKIRSSASLRQLPVILVTSLASPADVARGAEVGADEYVIKGEFDQQKLLCAVRRLIG